MSNKNRPSRIIISLLGEDIAAEIKVQFLPWLNQNWFTTLFKKKKNLEKNSP